MFLIKPTPHTSQVFFEGAVTKSILLRESSRGNLSSAMNIVGGESNRLCLGLRIGLGTMSYKSHRET